MAGSKLDIDLQPIRRAVIWAAAIIIALGIFREIFIWNIGTGTFFQDLRQIRFDAELSVPAWFSSMLMVGSAILLYVAGRIDAEQRRYDLRWTLLAVVFGLMAIDEMVAFHEVLIVPVREALGLTGALHYGWVVPGAAGVLLLGLYYIPFVFRLPHRSGLAFAVAGLVYVSGALGMEMVGGYLEYTVTKASLQYVVASSIEEILEIVGLTLFVIALMRHIRMSAPHLTFAVRDSVAP